MLAAHAFDSAALEGVLSYLVRAITNTETATVRALPVVGDELTFLVSAPNETDRLIGRDGETFRALSRIVRAMSWASPYVLRLVLQEHDRFERKGESIVRESEAAI